MTTKPLDHNDPNCARRGCTRQECIDTLRRHKAKLKNNERLGRKTGYFVDAQPVKDRIAGWRKRGYSLQEIATACDMSLTSIRNIETRRAHVMSTTAERVMSTDVRKVPVRLNARQGRPVSPTGTIRRLQALAALGYSQIELAALLKERGASISRRWVSDIISGRTEYVLRAKHDALVRLYAELEFTPSTAEYAWLCRKHAVGMRYATPAAWDGLDMDDPEVKPQGAVFTGRKYKKRRRTA